MSKRPHPSGQTIKQPAVIGAVIYLGNCLNLLDSQYIEMVKRAYRDLIKFSKTAGIDMPQNTGGSDLVDRKLDCAVLRMLHQTKKEVNDEPFDSVRAAFFEGDPLYENSGFASKSHIQVCVRDLRLIHGYFRPLDEKGVPIIFEDR